MPRFTALTLSNPPSKKRYVTRACDSCRKRKSRCNGLAPCSRCKGCGNVCSYDLPYTRGHAQTEVSDSERNRPKTSQASSPPPYSENSASASGLVLDSNASEFAEMPVDQGDASIQSFLRKVSSHLSRVGRYLPRSLFGGEQETHYEKNYSHVCILPDKETARSYLNCYFEHASISYRFVSHEQINEHLDQVYAELESALQEDTEMAKLLFVMGIGCIWMASWKKEALSPWKRKAYKLLCSGQSRLERLRDSFSPPLELLQAYVLKCQLELYFGRINSAWLTLGLAVRLGQLSNIQRKLHSEDAMKAHAHISLFWAMYMMDRYLAVALGLPFAIQDADITVPLVPELSEQVGRSLGQDETRLWVGVVAHVRLAQIIGHIMAALYSVTASASPPADSIMGALELELRQWLSQTPPFFHPKPESEAAPEPLFYDVPWKFKRQQRTIQGAFFFANMLLYRGYLLREFLQQVPDTPRRGPCPARVAKCVENAMAMLALAAEFGAEDLHYNSTFWISTHFIYCAISVLLVYLSLYQECDGTDRIKAAVELAIKTHLNNTDDQCDATGEGAETLTWEHQRGQVKLSSGLLSPTQRDGGTETLGPSLDVFSSGEVAVNGPWESSGPTEDALSTMAYFGPFDTSGDFDVVMSIGFDSHSALDTLRNDGFFEFQ